MNGTIVKCKFCGRLYRTQPYSAADQSCCPICQKEADDTMREAGKIPNPYKSRKKPWDTRPYEPKQPWEADPYRENKDAIWRTDPNKPYYPPKFWN